MCESIKNYISLKNSSSEHWEELSFIKAKKNGSNTYLDREGAIRSYFSTDVLKEFSLDDSFEVIACACSCKIKQLSDRRRAHKSSFDNRSYNNDSIKKYPYKLRLYLKAWGGNILKEYGELSFEISAIITLIEESESCGTAKQFYLEGSRDPSDGELTLTLYYYENQKIGDEIGSASFSLHLEGGETKQAQTSHYTASLIRDYLLINQVSKTLLQVLEHQGAESYEPELGCPFHEVCVYSTPQPLGGEDKLNAFGYSAHGKESSESKQIKAAEKLKNRQSDSTVGLRAEEKIEHALEGENSKIWFRVGSLSEGKEIVGTGVCKGAEADFYRIDPSDSKQPTSYIEVKASRSRHRVELSRNELQTFVDNPVSSYLFKATYRNVPMEAADLHQSWTFEWQVWKLIKNKCFDLEALLKHTAPCSELGVSVKKFSVNLNGGSFKECSKDTPCEAINDLLGKLAAANNA
jgi:hypothetical protein